MSQPQYLPHAAIMPGDNDRLHFAPEALRELADSLREHGLLSPIVVRPHPTQPGRYELVAGERRWRAAALLAWSTIPASVRDLSDEQAAAIMLTENVGRSDLNPIEEARGYQKRIARFGWTKSELAQLAGTSVKRVTQRLALLDLTFTLQELVAKYQFPIGHAESLATLKPQYQEVAVRVYERAGGMPLDRFGRMIADLRERQSAEFSLALFDPEAYWMAEAEAFTAPRRGKAAIVNVPVRSDLPSVPIAECANASDAILRYVRKLEACGHTREAAAIGVLYTELVHSNLMALPG